MTLKYEKGMMYKKGMILLLEKGKIKLIEGYMHNNFQNEFIYNCIYIDKDQKRDHHLLKWKTCLLLSLSLTLMRS